MAEDEDKDENENEGEDERLRRMGECEFRWRKEDRKTVKSVEKGGGGRPLAEEVGEGLWNKARK